jgi:RNA polymerase sigma factor (sigma-70 family)
MRAGDRAVGDAETSAPAFGPQIETEWPGNATADPLGPERMAGLAGAEAEVGDADGGMAAALQTGDSDRVMEILVSLHGEQVYGYCRRMLGMGADGDDVAQIVFVQAFQCLKDLPRVHNVRAWLLGIARHRCLDRLKAARRRALVFDGHDPADAVDRTPATPSDRADPRVIRALDDCLDRLDARSRAVLVLRFHDELSYEAMSKLGADTPGALRVRLVRALSALRRCLLHKGVQP